MRPRQTVVGTALAMSPTVAFGSNALSGVSRKVVVRTAQALSLPLPSAPTRYRAYRLTTLLSMRVRSMPSTL